MLFFTFSFARTDIDKAFFFGERSSLVSGLLIDVSVDNTTPSENESFCYYIRYRCASITENCSDASILMEFPEGIEVGSLSSGGNIKNSTVNILPSGNTEVTFDLETPGSTNGLVAGSSGRIRVCLSWACLPVGNSQIPTAGSDFNFSVNPTFNADGTSQVSNTPENVKVPSFYNCLPPPVSSGTGLDKTTSSTAGLVHPGGTTSFVLRRPAHVGPITFYDTIPPNTYFVDYVGQNNNTVELLIGGTWYDIGIGQINSWIETNFNNGTLDNLVASGVQTGAYVVFTNESPLSLGSYFLVGPTALRTTTPAGNNSAANRELNMYVDPNMAIGSTIQNCFSSSDPALGRSCADITVGDPNIPIIDFGKTFSSGFGEPYPTSFPFSRVAPIEKAFEDVTYSLSYVFSKGNSDSKAGLIISDTLPAGFDFVQGSGGNGWRVYLRPRNDVNEPFAIDTQTECFTPNFFREVDPASGRVIVKWEFTNCVFYGAFNSSPQLDVLFTTRYTGTEPLGGSIVNCAEATFSDDQELYCHDFGPNIRGNCPSKSIEPLPALDASIVAAKYVNGKLDNNYSKSPIFGDTDTSGVASYELYIYNYGFESLKKLDVVDILPHIGDYSLTTETARLSEWNTELIDSIEVERLDIGIGWSSDDMHVLGDILYSDTYTPCYKDNTGQVRAATGLTEPVSQSCGSTDFSATNPLVGAKAFALTWEDDVNPIAFGEAIRLRIYVQQPTGDLDAPMNSVAWNSFAVTGTQSDDTELFSTEPLKVGLRNTSDNLIGDYVWEDVNGNGIQDIGEPGISNITVSLYEANGDTVKVAGVPLTTITDSLGYYDFVGVLASTNYIVRLDTPNDFLGGGVLNGLSLSVANNPAVTDDLDSDAILGFNNGTSTESFPEVVAMSNPPMNGFERSYDFGFYQGAQICGYAWNDANGFGDQDQNELPLDSIIVILKNSSNIEVQRDTTDVAGNYNFEDVIPGSYLLEIDTSLIMGLIFTPANLTGDDNNDSDATASGIIDNIIVHSGEIICNNDIGMTKATDQPATIIGEVWDELSKDGLLDATEEGVSNILLYLLDASGLVVNSTYTDNMGAYQFDNIEPNQTYNVQVIPDTAIDVTPNQNVGMDDTIDNDFDSLNGISDPIIPAPNEFIENVDVGLCMLYSIGNLVWNDANNNGLNDNSELPFPGLKVWLLDGMTSVPLDSTITDSNGKYLFSNLNPENYIIEVEIPNLFRSTNDISSTGDTNQLDNDENGIGTRFSGKVSSGLVSIVAGAGMPGDANWTELDHGQIINGSIDNTSNPKAYYTVDFGFFEASCKSNICLPVNIVRK